MPKLKKKIYRKDIVKASQNCYSYFLNEISEDSLKRCKKRKSINKKLRCRRPQPGYASGYNNGKRLTKKSYKNCKEIVERTLSDNSEIYRTTRKKKCKKNYYKGAVFLDKNKDYHYYREDKPNQWSHKPGRHIPSAIDAKGKKIKNPETAAKVYKSVTKSNIYDKLCSYFCVPNKTKKVLSVIPVTNSWGLSENRKTKKIRK